MHTTFGARLREARRVAGLSQAELAARVSQITGTRTLKSLVSQWETNRIANPHNRTVLAIARVLSVSPDFLITGKKATVTPIKPETGREMGAVADTIADDKVSGVAYASLRTALHRTLLALLEIKPALTHADVDTLVTLTELVASTPSMPNELLVRTARVMLRE